MFVQIVEKFKKFEVRYNQRTIWIQLFFNFNKYSESRID